MYKARNIRPPSPIFGSLWTLLYLIFQLFFAGGGLVAGSYLPVVHSVSPNLCLLLSLEVLDI